MKKTEDQAAVNEWVQERYDLSKARLKEIAEGNTVQVPFRDFFEKNAKFMLDTEDIYEMRADGRFGKLKAEELEMMNYYLYRDILPGNIVLEADDDEDDEDMVDQILACISEGLIDPHYEMSYANPAYTAQIFGEEYGQLLSWLAAEVRALIPMAFKGLLADMTAVNELFIEIYNCFEHDVPPEEEIRKIIYWYVSDYTDQTVAMRIREQIDPSLTFYKDIIMQSDLNDLSYLYQYGDYISDNEKEIAAYLNSLDQSVIDGMAETLVEGYVRGFELYKIDLSVKKNVQIRANIGFERVLRSVIRKFEAMGLTAVIYGDAVHGVMKKNVRIGYCSCPANPQYDYDHRMDKGLYLDKALCERIVGVTRSAYEEYKELAAVMAGPTLMEVFGEKPFEPKTKTANVKLSDKQERLAVRLAGQMAEIANQYIDASSTSFAIIAWPLPSIGADFEAIMEETIKVNNLDNDVYRKIQQAMIDAMDGAAYMHITGMNGNQTDLKVALWQLADPEKETVFENCCADVNIPVGEVFTSPVLAGTDGVLNVSGVYLNGLNYRNLTLTFKDGCIADYHCSNYEDEAENKAYLKQNLLQNRETLPMGEFAIGTNTTAYAMARRFGISSLMPILIMEKTGPHFAVGDTCYSHSEDHKVYNLDGKEIVARENEMSRLRHTDMEHAYFNVHTDITIPYDEIGAITACFADGQEVDIIKNGRFCLKGTEALNDALNI